MDSINNQIIQDRTKKIISFIKKNVDWVIYIALAYIVCIALWIRTRNLSGLRDITTGGWTLGPDLDPFLFLRWAKYIVENGSLFAIDNFRSVPLGFNTGLEFPLLHHSIAWFHKLAILFGSVSVEQSASLYPLFMFALTAIAFFFMTREALFNVIEKKYSSIAALVATLFLAIIPSFLPRTIAGIPEKESVAFLFLFAAFYFFLVSWRLENRNKSYIYSILGGIFAGLMALTWGGFAYLSILLSGIMLIMFLFGKTDIYKILNYTLFIFITYSLPFIFFERFTISAVFNGFDSIFVILSLVVFWSDIAIHKYGLKYIIKPLRTYPRLTSLIYGGLLLVILGLFSFGPEFIINHLNSLYNKLIGPATSRLIQTVAENRQPFFVEWASNFGPIIKGIPMLLIIPLISSIILLYQVLNETNLKKLQKITLLSSWIVFVFALTFTRYSSTSLFNGLNFLSKFVYFIGIFMIFITFIYINIKSSKLGEKDSYKNIPIGVIFILLFFSIALVSARAYIRLVLMLVPIVSILTGYIFAKAIKKINRGLNEKKIFTSINIFYAIVILVIIFTAYVNYFNSRGLAQNYVPSAYNQQWQMAMSWVRENTPSNAVFGHWWDYGYWVQSLGQRATMLDGGNYLGYWNYLMGRYGLTESVNFTNTMEFLYTHNITHFLIDSTDIGKYSAFSTIGSNSTYDRRSWIPTFLKDGSQTTERKNATVFVYPGGTLIDQDITYNNNGTELFLPEGKAYVAAVVLIVNQVGEVYEVFGVYFLQDKTYQIPLRYYWDKSIGFVDTQKGIDAGVFIYPSMVINAQGGDIDQRGAMLYLSPKTVKSNLARFYLYGEQNDNFRLAHSQPDALVEMLKTQGAQVGDFVYYNEFRGPIKIWEVRYPSNIRFNEEYLQTEYPDDILYS